MSHSNNESPVPEGLSLFYSSEEDMYKDSDISPFLDIRSHATKE